MNSPILISFLAFFLTGGLLLALAPLAAHWGLLDHPDGRKQHRQATPLIGGLAVGASLSLLLPIFAPGNSGWQPLLLASLILLLVGMLDDLRDLSPGMRFLAQIAATLVMSLWGGATLVNLGDLMGAGDALTASLALPFTVFCGLGVMNAVNMQDGLDGLAGALMLVFFGLLALLAAKLGLGAELVVLAAILGALLAFLVFNFPWTSGHRAKVFLGDAGSLLLGGLVTWFLIRFSQEPLHVLSPITAVWLLAVPLMDAVGIMVRRMAQGRSPFRPDRYHLHHILLALGLSVRAVVLVEVGLSILLALLGLAGERWQVPEYLMFWGFLGLFALFLSGMELGWRRLGSR